MAETYTIADLARAFDVTTRTIRYYEDEGMLAPERRGQQRIFGPRDRARLKLILRGKRLGFSLGEIREILAMYDAEPGEAGQLRHMLARIRERRSTLENKRRDISETLAELAEVEGRCQARLNKLERDARRSTVTS